MEISDIPADFGEFIGVNETAAQLILSIAVICMILFPTMILAKGKNAPMVWLIMVFLGECLVLALGWLPFWIMIMTIAVTALSIGVLSSGAITGG